MSADVREVVAVEACWKHEAPLSSMDPEQAADYAEACEDCTVTYADPPEPIPGQMSIGPSVEDAAAPVLEEPAVEFDDVDTSDIDDPEYPGDGYFQQTPEEEAEADRAAEVVDIEDPPDTCPKCGLEVLNARTHPNVCTGAPKITGNPLDDLGAKPGVQQALSKAFDQAADMGTTTPDSPPPAPAAKQNDYIPEEALFSEEEFRTSPVINLRKRFTEPPFTVLNRKGGDWIKRDQQWKTLGIQSELGRDEGLLGYENLNSPDFNDGQFNTLQSTSIFSPTLAELAVRWYSATDSQVLDPFAGGSVRGLVAGMMGRHYTGIDLSSEQVEANREQVSIMDENRARGLTGAYDPEWIAGDSAELETLLPAGKQYDLIFSCPPYAYLENYSDDPRDISSLSYPGFLEAYRKIISRAVGRLHNDRFIAWVIGEVREKGGHACLGLVPDTIKAFQDAGCGLYNDHVVLLPIASAAIRTPKQFNASRKAGRVHEYMLVFVKGDGKRAARWVSATDGPL